MRRLFWLSDRQWELIKPHLPYRAAGVTENLTMSVRFNLPAPLGFVSRLHVEM